MIFACTNNQKQHNPLNIQAERRMDIKYSLGWCNRASLESTRFSILRSGVQVPTLHQAMKIRTLSQQAISSGFSFGFRGIIYALVFGLPRVERRFSLFKSRLMAESSLSTFSPHSATMSLQRFKAMNFAFKDMSFCHSNRNAYYCFIEELRRLGHLCF